MSWYKYIGGRREVTIDHFGASAPAGILLRIGFTVENVVAAAEGHEQIRRNMIDTLLMIGTHIYDFNKAEARRLRRPQSHGLSLRKSFLGRYRV